MNSPINLTDRVPLSGAYRDQQGNLVCTGRAARTGIQIYSGYEVGRPDLSMVRVWRPEEEVFHRDSIKTYAGAPVCIDHPGVDVTPKNWKDFAKGETDNEIVRDGETVRVPFLVRDANAIGEVEDGKHEISMGYACILDFSTGQVPAGQRDEGQAYDAIQRNIRINHLAIVDKARAGPDFRIGDDHDRSISMADNAPALIAFTYDGFTAQVNDAARQLLDKMANDLKVQVALVAERDATITAKDGDIEKLTGEKTALEAQVTELKDASSPEKLALLATSRAALLADAKRLAPKVVTDGKTDAEIRRGVVEARAGEAGKALKDGEGIDGAYAMIVAQNPAPKGGNGAERAAPANDTVADALAGGGLEDAEDAISARDAAKNARLSRYANGGEDKKAAASA